MNRADRIRKAVPSLAEEHIAALARLGLADVDVVIKAIRQARRDERLHQAKLKRQARIDKRNQPGLADEGFKAEEYADSLFLKSIVPRAGRSLDHLARLKQHYDDGPSVLSLAVAGARAQGYSDGHISKALGVTRQAVSQRFPRQDHLAGEREAADRRGAEVNAGHLMTMKPSGGDR